MKTNVKKSVELVNSVNNYFEAQSASKASRALTGRLDNARRALSGLAKEVITFKDADKKAHSMTMASFMAQVGCPYANGHITLRAIMEVWAKKDSETGHLQICKNVVQKVKIGKTNYSLYKQNEDGTYETVKLFVPVTVRPTGWNPTLIVQGLAQSHFEEEIDCMIAKSREDYNAIEKFYVKDELTGAFVEVARK